MKYIIVTGSVMSGIGKGITASSIGAVIKGYGLRVTAIKIDPYLNLDSGTMSPFEHGECYILNDGGETDLDLGNYERFLDIALTREHNITTGKIYKQVLDAERRGDYLGKTVQIIPHITNAIQEWIERVALVSVDGSGKEPQLCLIELGGTVGDYESLPFVEALRQLCYRIGRENYMIVNVSYLPVLETSDETKTKPTQKGVQDSRSLGLNPDILCLRCKREITAEARTKLSNFCQIPEDQILLNPDVPNIYQIPLAFDEHKLMFILERKMNLSSQFEISRGHEFWESWRRIADGMELAKDRGKQVRIAVVGKYTGMVDSYLSLTHAIRHAGLFHKVYPEIHFIDSDKCLEHGSGWEIEGFDGVIIPGGFGQRGIEGMVSAAKYCREEGLPCLGICLGFQVQVIEFARNVLNLEGANSVEIDEKTPHPVICIIDEDSTKQMGGSMRLGGKVTALVSNSRVCSWYDNEKECSERYRHRYEVNPDYIESLQSGGLQFPGVDETGRRMEILDVTGKRFYVGTQFHGEYQTHPHRSHPIFRELLGASVEFVNKRFEKLK